MVPTANNHTPTPEPTGDLEQLFRQKLGEAEVAPRMHLWEQIDHELLVQQNETFRQRLVWHRWAAAACILLFLAAGSWFTLRPAGLPAPTAELAAASSAAQPAASASVGLAAAGLGENPAASGLGVYQQHATGQDQFAARTAPPAEDLAAASANAGTQSDAAQLAMLTTRPSVTLGGTAASGSYSTYSMAPTPSGYAAARRDFPGSSATTVGAFFDRMMGAAQSSYSGTPASAASFLTALSSRAATAGAGLLPAAQPDTLKSFLATTPTKALAQTTVPAEDKQPEVAAARPKRWRLMGGYAASAYNPNMSFGGTSVASTANSFTPMASRIVSSSYENAAKEYRQNLRPGFAQRVALTISYAATKHWTMSTGVTAAEQRAASQTSYYFLDGKMPMTEMPVASAADGLGNLLAPPRIEPLRTAQYRYRTAGIPVSVRYGSPKNGWSLYAKVGAAVDVLLNTRSELAGVPEATTTYSLRSPNSPYRKVQGSVNGGAGVRYKPATAQWTVALGPTAEAGLSTLNAAAAQTTYQARPYAVGMEASVEFGSKTALVAH